jgi:hypothetical protein
MLAGGSRPHRPPRQFTNQPSGPHAEGARRRCSRRKVRCAGCNTRTGRGPYRRRFGRPTLFLDDPTRTRCRRRSSRAVPNRIRHGPPSDYLMPTQTEQTGKRLPGCAEPRRREGPEHAKRLWRSHLARAKWMITSGFKHLLLGGAPIKPNILRFSEQPMSAGDFQRVCASPHGAALGASARRRRHRRHPRMGLQAQVARLIPAPT